MDKIIVNYTPTGMVPTKIDNPFIPISITEIVEDVKEAYKTGITMVHLHARQEDGNPCYKKETYGRIIAGIREFSKELLICVSTSGRHFPEFFKRAEVLSLEGDLKPDMASLTLSSLNFYKHASMNNPETITKLVQQMNERGIKPELEAFDSGMINVAQVLLKRGLLKPPHYFNLIMGNIASAQADFLHLGLMINNLPQDSIFSIGGIGQAQLKMNSLAISIGAGVRVGLEDNIWYDHERKKHAKNSELLKRIRSIINANEKEVMTAIELREKLNLKREVL